MVVAADVPADVPADVAAVGVAVGVAVDNEIVEVVADASLFDVVAVLVDAQFDSASYREGLEADNVHCILTAVGCLECKFLVVIDVKLLKDS